MEKNRSEMKRVCKRMTSVMTVLTIAAVILCGCQESIDDPDPQPKPDETLPTVKGMWVLNEGCWGTNNASLDWYDYATGLYSRNVFGERNPQVVKELGDVGNDLGIYGGKLWAVINASGIVEVMDVRTGRHLGQVTVPNCRSLAFDGGYAYVTSYAGPIGLDPNAQQGYVARIDTTTFAVADSCVVGYQPEEMAVVGGRLYVANSGGYMAPDYDHTLSVVDLTSFTLTSTIEVGVNPRCVKADQKRGLLYVSISGDYAAVPPSISIVDVTKGETIQSIPQPCGNMALVGDSLYILGSSWSWETYTTTFSRCIWDLDKRAMVSDEFITDGTAGDLIYPYGLAVNPDNGDILLTDAGDFMTPGTVHCYDKTGKKKWSEMAGVAPSKLVFPKW